MRHGFHQSQCQGSLSWATNLELQRHRKFPQKTHSTHRGFDVMGVVVLEALPVAVMGVEAAICRRVLASEEAQVPFADSVCRIPGLLQVLWQHLLTERQTPRFWFKNHQVLHTYKKASFLRTKLLNLYFIR